MERNLCINDVERERKIFITIAIDVILRAKEKEVRLKGKRSQKCMGARWRVFNHSFKFCLLIILPC